MLWQKKHINLTYFNQFTLINLKVAQLFDYNSYLVTPTKVHVGMV